MKKISHCSNVSIVNNYTVNQNYLITCKLCNKKCDNIICDNCKETFISESKNECEYCKQILKASEMYKHLYDEHILNVNENLCTYC